MTAPKPVTTTLCISSFQSGSIRHGHCCALKPGSKVRRTYTSASIDDDPYCTSKYLSLEIKLSFTPTKVSLHLLVSINLLADNTRKPGRLSSVNFREIQCHDSRPL